MKVGSLIHHGEYYFPMEVTPRAQEYGRQLLGLRFNTLLMD